MEAQAGTIIARERAVLAERIVALHYEWEPSLAERYGPEGRAKCLQDAAYHLNYLAEALLAGSALLFIDYVRWAAAMLVSRNIPTSDLVHNLRCMQAVMMQDLPAGVGAIASGYLSEALGSLGVPAQNDPDRESALRTLASSYLAALVEGDAPTAQRLVEEAVAQDIPVRDIYLDVFQWTQHEIGRLWQTNQMSVAQEHLGTAVTRQLMAQLTPHFAASTPRGKTFVMACVAEELHEIGARMVTDFFALEGWTTYYLGANVPQRDVIEMVKMHDADVLGISTTLIAHLSRATSLVQAIRSDPACAHVNIIVGGYPFNVDPEIWHQIGANGSAHSADAAVRLAEELIS